MIWKGKVARGEGSGRRRVVGMVGGAGGLGWAVKTSVCVSFLVCREQGTLG